MGGDSTRLKFSNIRLRDAPGIGFVIILFSIATLLSMYRFFTGWVFIIDLYWGICLLLYLCSLATLFLMISEPMTQWNCGHCLKRLREESLITKSKLTVISTSNTTKQITTSNSQAGAGIHGSQTVSFTSTGSSTSHVPIVLGRISATYRCKSRNCGKSIQWQFDSEVQVWIDRSTGRETYDISHGVILPRFGNNYLRNR